MRPTSITHDAQARGLESEERVLEACRLEPRPSWMRRARRATRTEDNSGIDVVVESDVGRLFVQVKSSRRGAAEFRPRKFLRIGIVVVRRGDSPGLLLAKVVDALRVIRAQYLKEMRAKGVVRVEPGESPRRPRAVVPPPAPKPFKTKWKRPLEDPTEPAAQVGTNWSELRDCLLAAMLRAGPRPSTDDELRLAAEALAKRSFDLEAVVARYPAVLQRGEAGMLRTPLDRVSAYRLRLARCWDPPPRDVLRKVLELLASIAVAGDSVLQAELPRQLLRASNGELTEDQVNRVLHLVRADKGWERAPGEPASKIRVLLRPWLLDAAQALARLEEGAWRAMGPFLPVDGEAMGAALAGFR